MRHQLFWKKFKSIAISISLLTFIFTPLNPLKASAAETLTIAASTPVTSSIDSVGRIWQGNIPTKVVFPAGSFSMKLEFPIQALLPYSVVGDKATGTDVEFEIWSAGGKKVAYDTVYSFDWNPVGPNTLVSMYVSEADANATHTLIIRTIYELSTNGLLTRYLKDEKTMPIQFRVARKPDKADIKSANMDSTVGNLTYTYSNANYATKYEVGITYLRPGSTVLTTSASYYPFTYLKTVTSSPFTVTFDEIKGFLKDKNVDLSKSSIGISLRGVNEYMIGDWGYWYYTETKFIAEADARAKSAADAAQAALVTLRERCNKLNTAVLDLSMLIDVNLAKYPSNTIFPVLKNSLPSMLDCNLYTDVTFKGKVDAQDSKLAYIDSELVAAMKSEVDKNKPIAKTTTISCVKGKLTKKVTGINPKCPAGYKKK